MTTATKRAARPIDRLLHLVHPLALAPLALLIFDYLNSRLSPNPIQDLTFRTGLPALVLLIGSLACTPANLGLGWKWAVKLRRPLGLYAFLYATLHMLVFVVLDYGLDPALLWNAVAEKRYILAGSAALLLLTPLAITSTKGWQKRLGKRWKLLHKLVYVAAPLAVIHFVWLVKSDIREPLIYGAVLLLLLALRLPLVRRLLPQRRPAALPSKG